MEGYLYKIEGKMKRTLLIFENKVIFKQIGEKDTEIIFENISVVHFKEAKLTAGYLRFVLAGDTKTKLDVSSASVDPYSVIFAKENNEIAEKIVEWTELKLLNFTNS